MSEFLEPSEEEEVGYFDRALLPGDEGQPVSAVTATESMCRLPTRMLASMSNSLPDLCNLHFFRRELLFLLLSKGPLALLSIAPLMKKEGLKIPPSLLSIVLHLSAPRL